MSVKSQIEDSATSQTAMVSESSLHVIQHPAPPATLGTELEVIPFRQFFTTDAGSSDMAVNGAVTSVEFCLRANASLDRDRYITTISVLLSDGTMDLSIFGGIGVLANGLDFEFNDPRIGTVVIDSGIVRNIDFMRLALGVPSVGTGDAAFIAGAVSAPPTKDDAYLPVIDLNRTFGFMPGLRLPARSTSELTFRVNDDLTGLTEFNIIAYGFERLL